MNLVTKIISIGNTCLDIILRYTDRIPEWGTEIFLKETHWRLGGQGANFAAACCALGYPTHLVTNLGSDNAGTRLKSELRSIRLLDNRFLLTRPGKTGFTVSLVRSDGERLFLTFLGHQNFFSTKRNMRHIVQTVEKNDIVHVSGYYMLPRLRTELLDLLHVLRSREARISFDPGWPPFGFAKHERDDLKTILQQIDFFEPNETELLAMTRKARVSSAVDSIRRWFPGVIALKRGGRGCIVFSEKKPILVKAFKTHALDTTGAGDVFDAGFLTGVTRNYPLKACARRANRAAAIFISKGMSQLSRMSSSF